MLRIESLTLPAAPGFAARAEQSVRSLKRYFMMSACVATASLVVALGVSLVTLLVAGPADQSSEARSTAYIQEVSSASNEGVSLRREILDPDPEPEVKPAPESEPLPPAAPVLVQRVVPDREIVKVKGRVHNVNITFYDCKNQGFCGAMYNGRKVYQGAAACSWNLAIGTKFFIVGDPTRRVYVCEDRGLLADTWVDIFWNSPRDGWWWQSKVGRKGTIEIVGLP